MLDGRRSGRVHAAVTARRVLVKREQGICLELEDWTTVERHGLRREDEV